MTELFFDLFIALCLLYMGWLLGEYTARRRDVPPTTPPPTSMAQQRPSHLLDLAAYKLEPPVIDLQAIQRERDRAINKAIVARHMEPMKPQPRQGNNLN